MRKQKLLQLVEGLHMSLRVSRYQQEIPREQTHITSPPFSNPESKLRHTGGCFKGSLCNLEQRCLLGVVTLLGKEGKMKFWTDRKSPGKPPSYFGRFFFFIVLNASSAPSNVEQSCCERSVAVKHEALRWSQDRGCWCEVVKRCAASLALQRESAFTHEIKILDNYIA